MIDKQVGLAESIKEISAGNSIVIGGWGPFRKPMALLREILRSSIKDLTILSFAGMDPPTDAELHWIRDKIDPLGVRRLDFVRGEEYKNVMAEIMDKG